MLFCSCMFLLVLRVLITRCSKACLSLVYLVHRFDREGGGLGNYRRGIGENVNKREGDWM